MGEYEERGRDLRRLAKSLVLHFMKSSPDCQPSKNGMKLSRIFRECGFDWGEYMNATSSHQQYWVVALVRELESEGVVERVGKSGPWRLVLRQTPGTVLE